MSTHRGRPATGGPATDNPNRTVSVSRPHGKRLPVRVAAGVATWSVTSAAHVLRRPPALAKAERWLLAAEAAGATCCEVLDLRDPAHPVTWRAPLRAWWGRYSVPIPGRGGYEAQRALLLSAPCWELEGDAEGIAAVMARPAAERPRPPEPAPAGPVATQLALPLGDSDPLPDPAAWARGGWRRRT